jgi:hypothetical protein
MAQPVVTGAYLHSDSGSGGELVPNGGIVPGAILFFPLQGIIQARRISFGI